MSMIRSRVLDAESTIGLEVTYPAEGSLDKINIRGSSRNSVDMVKKITCDVEGEKMTIKVYLGLVGKKSAYRVDYTVLVPPSVNEVFLGNQKVWERHPIP